MFGQQKPTVLETKRDVGILQIRILDMGVKYFVRLLLDQRNGNVNPGRLDALRHIGTYCWLNETHYNALASKIINGLLCKYWSIYYSHWSGGSLGSLSRGSSSR